MPVARIFVPQIHGAYPSIPVLPVRLAGPTGPTGPGQGLTVTVINAKLSSTGATGSMTFTAGLLTAQTPAS